MQDYNMLRFQVGMMMGNRSQLLVLAIKNQDWKILLEHEKHDFSKHYLVQSWQVSPDYEGWVDVQQTDYSSESFDGMRGASSSSYTTKKWMKIPASGRWVYEKSEYSPSLKNFGFIENPGMGMKNPTPKEFPSCPVDYMKDLLEKNILNANKWEAERNERIERLLNQKTLKEAKKFLYDKIQSIQNHRLKIQQGVELKYKKDGCEIHLGDLQNGYVSHSVISFFDDKSFDVEKLWLEAEPKLKERIVFLEECEQKNKEQEKLEREEQEKSEKEEKIEIEELKNLFHLRREKSGRIIKKEESSRFKFLCAKYPNILD